MWVRHCYSHFQKKKTSPAARDPFCYAQLRSTSPVPPPHRPQTRAASWHPATDWMNPPYSWGEGQFLTIGLASLQDYKTSSQLGLLWIAVSISDDKVIGHCCYAHLFWGRRAAKLVAVKTLAPVHISFLGRERDPSILSLWIKYVST